ncbi:hypothetical protein NIES22_60440 [Calothrix brevissima NIES-22]|nr:hypothetical protein NIES22_60440 [Calothrix brevissima NIES-22]
MRSRHRKALKMFSGAFRRMEVNQFWILDFGF